MQENNVHVSEIEQTVSVEDVSTEVFASESSVSEVKVTESIVDNPNAISHADLTDRTLPNQHPIASIVGLRDELDRLATAHTNVKGGGYAQYYPWSGSGPDGIGYFVSVAEDGNIKICTNADEDVLGVIVSEEKIGFIGSTIDPSDAAKYGLVCLLGTVEVRVTDEVQVGDYIVPNALGMATGVATTESCAQTIVITDADYYGLNHTPIAMPKLYMLDDDGGLGDAVAIGDEASGKTVVIDGIGISVDVGDDGYKVGDRLYAIYDYVNNNGLGYKVTKTSYRSGVHYATISLIPNGNALYRLQFGLNDALDRVSVAESNVVTAINRANDAYGLAELASGEINTNIYNDIKESIEKAESAEKKANSAVESVNQIEKTIDNIETAANEAKTDAAEAKAEVESLWAENGVLTQSVQSLIGHVSEYTVGEHSQAYGLSLEHAIKILPDGLLYVPTVEHTEEYASGDDFVKQVFYRGYSYTWSGGMWQSSDEEDVYFSGAYIDGNAAKPYWYTDSTTDVTHENMTYPKETLYVWQNGAWVAVATLGNNSLSRVVSLVQQTENEVKTEIVSAKGDYVSISERLKADEAEIAEIAKWEDSIASTRQKADKNEASITQLAQFGYEVKSYNELDKAPTGDAFYINKPEWINGQWVFSGDSYEDVGNVDGVEYCYAENPDDLDTYHQYKCGADNKWTEITIGRAAYTSGIEQKANENGATLNMIVANLGDENGNVDVASIALRVNEEGSQALIRADRIDFEAGDYTIDSKHFTLTAEDAEIIADQIDLTGYVTIEDLEGEGQTIIDGSHIKTGAIESNGYAYTSGNFSDAGTSLDLETGAIMSPTFSVDADGNSHFAGTIHSPNGEIGGFVIGTDAIYNEHSYMLSGMHMQYYMTSPSTITGLYGLRSDSNFVYVGTDGVGTMSVILNPEDPTLYGNNENATKLNSYIADGKLFSNSAEITGRIIATEGEFTDVVIQSGWIGGFTIDAQKMYVQGKTSLSSSTMPGIYIGPDGISVGGTLMSRPDLTTYYANVTLDAATGKLTANNAEITGKIIATDGEFTGKVIAISGYIGTASRGFEIGENSIYNVRSHNDVEFHMTSPNTLNSYDTFAGGMYVGDYRGYVYVGTDGIGAMKVAFSDSKVVAQTYIKDGDLYTNSGVIGDGEYTWTIGNGKNNAYLYCGSQNIASSGGITMPATNNVYLGTDGMSYTLGTSDNNLDYTTLIRSGNILVYGDSEPGHSRATHLHYNGIDFFYAGSSVISQIGNLADYKVGGIGIDGSGDIVVEATNSINIAINDISLSLGCLTDTPSLTANKFNFDITSTMNIDARSIDFDIESLNVKQKGMPKYKGLNGWIMGGGPLEKDQRYLHFVHGILVESTTTEPEDGSGML